MAIEPIKGFYVHDEVTDTDGAAKVSASAIEGFGDEPTCVTFETRPGYVNADGRHVNQGSGTQEVYTNKIPVFPGDDVTITLQWNGDTSSVSEKWLAWVGYDENGGFISRPTLISGGTSNPQTKTVSVPSGVYYVAFTYRTYGDVDVAVKYKGSLFDVRNRTAKGLLKEADGYDKGMLDTNDYNNGVKVLWAGHRAVTGFIEASKKIALDIDTGTNWATLGIWWWVLEFDGNKDFIRANNYVNYEATKEMLLSDSCRFVRIEFENNGFPNSASGSPSVADVKRYIRILTETNTVETDYSWLFGENVKGINHRGYYTAPENTLPAYKLSKKQGFKYCECDVSMTSDRVPVLLHDDTINRTARNADGTAISETISIGSITYDEALEYDFGIYKASEYAGTKIPKFEDFIILCRSLGLHPYIELKTAGGYTEAEIQNLVDIVHACGMGGKVSWISFGAGLLTYVKNYDSSARLGYVVGDVDASVITTAQGLKTADNEVFIDAGSALTSEEVSLCSAADIPLEVWTVDSESTIQNLDPYVSGVTSDNLIAAKVLYDANKD